MKRAFLFREKKLNVLSLFLLVQYAVVYKKKGEMALAVADSLRVMRKVTSDDGKQNFCRR